MSFWCDTHLVMWRYRLTVIFLFLCSQAERPVWGWFTDGELNGVGWGQNPNLRISFSVSFQHAKPPSWTSSELLIPPGRLPEGLWRGSSSKSGSNSYGFPLIHGETPAGHLIPYISPPSRSSGTSSSLCISSDLTLAKETLIIRSDTNHLCRKQVDKVRTFRNGLGQLLFHNKKSWGDNADKAEATFVILSSLCISLWWNFHSRSVKLYPPLDE